MAVEIKYVVVRKGEEKMTFASKKEADAYDKMLDMAEVFSDWLSVAPLTIEEEQREALGMFLAENKDAVQHILRTSKLPEGTDVVSEVNESAPLAEHHEEVAESEEADDAVEVEKAEVFAKAARPSRASKAA
ncbi:YebG family protein [Pantoea sp. BAV 3049]|uniref:YebG family protein n=1 Tax=Pantoea sp. BAV 3049 TaxID=2654188 RepID=UPI00131D63A7|nr:YebG family protein [Pantoea sp. BAV 3049]